MLCPVCRFDNFEGEDSCTNCGADLSASDLPQPAQDFHDTIAVAINKMAVGGFRHIPLMRHGRVTGIVSTRDLSHHLVTLLG